MNTHEQFIICINRELGSGGRTIGRKLAQKLGVPFYDKALIEALQQKYGLTVDEIESLKGRSHSWWADFKRAFSIGYAMSNSTDYDQSVVEEPDLLTTDNMYKAEQEILRGIASSESCVMAGRTAFYVFRNHPNHLNVFIQASREHRARRIMEKQGISRDEALKTIDDVDRMRENYVNRYTGTSRYDTRNYQLVFSMDGKTEDEIVELIMNYIQPTL